MLSEQDKQAILNGAYGRTRDGRKAKFLYESEVNSSDYRYLFLINNKDEDVAEWLDKSLKLYEEKIKPEDIVGLWEESNEPEPFNLERALSGEPVLLKNGLKAFILKEIENDALSRFLKYPKSFLGGFTFGDGLISTAWNKECDALSHDDDYSIIGMWQEPKRPTVTLTLPCPLKSLDNVDKAYSTFLEAEKGGDAKLIIYEFPKENFHEKRVQEQLAFGNLFASQEQAEAWEYAKQNNRR